jgi:hypothetical protein
LRSCSTLKSVLIKKSKIVIFGNFETSPVAMVTGNLRYRDYGLVNICALKHLS